MPILERGEKADLGDALLMVADVTDELGEVGTPTAGTLYIQDPAGEIDEIDFALWTVTEGSGTVAAGDVVPTRVTYRTTPVDLAGEWRYRWKFTAGVQGEEGGSQIVRDTNLAESA